MLSGLGDMDEHSSKKLEGVHELGIVGVVSGFGLVDDELGFWMKVEPAERVNDFETVRVRIYCRTSEPAGMARPAESS